MPATFLDDLDRHLSRLLSETETVSDFRHWFSKAWWEAESSADDSIFDLASTIEHYIYILDDGVWDDRTFKQKVGENWLDFRRQVAARTEPAHTGTI